MHRYIYLLRILLNFGKIGNNDKNIFKIIVLNNLFIRKSMGPETACCTEFEVTIFKRNFYYFYATVIARIFNHFGLFFFWLFLLFWPFSSCWIFFDFRGVRDFRFVIIIFFWFSSAEIPKRGSNFSIFTKTKRRYSWCRFQARISVV
jgi:hypothetical protein